MVGDNDDIGLVEGLEKGRSRDPSAETMSEARNIDAKTGPSGLHFVSGDVGDEVRNIRQGKIREGDVFGLSEKVLEIGSCMPKGIRVGLSCTDVQYRRIGGIDDGAGTLKPPNGERAVELGQITNIKS